MNVPDALEIARNKHKLPALAGAIVTGKELVDIGAVGVREAGGTAAVTTNDLWHLGSNTKAMTATLIGALVQQDRFQWRTTVGELFPDAPAESRPVTLLHLLSHRAGLAGNADCRKLDRRQAVLSAQVQSSPGTKYEYSNLGYVIAGAMAEQATGATWEELMRQHVFTPLGMTSAGFGDVGANQPRPHTAAGLPVPPPFDNPPVLGPAGRVHCTLQDWSKFIADLLCGSSGEPGLLSVENYWRIITPPFGGEYALGWIVYHRDWGGGNVLAHNGSNTLNYSVAWVAPKRGFAVMVCCNQRGDVAPKACNEVVRALIPR